MLHVKDLCFLYFYVYFCIHVKYQSKMCNVHYLNVKRFHLVLLSKVANLKKHGQLQNIRL